MFRSLTHRPARIRRRHAAAVVVPTQGGTFAALPRSALALVNSSALASHTLAALGARFDAAFACRAHVAHFVAEGMEVSELAEAREDVAELAAEYEAAAADTLPPGAPAEAT